MYGGPYSERSPSCTFIATESTARLLSNWSLTTGRATHGDGPCGGMEQRHSFCMVVGIGEGGRVLDGTANEEGGELEVIKDATCKV